MVEAPIIIGPPEAPIGRMTWVLPAGVSRLLAPLMAPGREGHEGLERVMPVTVSAVAVLTQLTMSLADLRRLKPGALLDVGTLGPVQVFVGGVPVLHGSGGTSDGRRCVKIAGRGLPEVNYRHPSTQD